MSRPRRVPNLFALSPALCAALLTACVASTSVEPPREAQPAASPAIEEAAAVDVWKWFGEQAEQRDRDLRADPEWGLLLEVRVRWQCLGLCGSNEASEIRFRRDGHSTYLGWPDGRPHGRYVHDGSASLHVESRLFHADERRVPFLAVAEYVTSAGLRDLDDEYTSNTFDAVECHYTFVWERHTKKVREWAGAGPIELWVLDRLLFEAAEDMDWQLED